MQVKRIDSYASELRLDSSLTPEGYIHADGVTTRCGIFIYRNNDGSIRRELRHPEDVFDAASLATMKMLPVVNTHEGGFVNSENAKARQIGFVGQEVRADGMLVKAPVRITTADGVSAVQAGRNKLSLGYLADTEPAPKGALFDGEPYDFRQRNIRYNHLAIVDAPRAGSVAQLKLDSEDAIQIDGNTLHFDGDSNMKKKITYDGVEYEVDAQVAVALEKAAKRADDAEGEAKAAKTEAATAKAAEEAAKGKMDQAVADAKKAKEDATKNYDADVKERVELVLVAQEMLDADALKKLDGMKNDEIRIAVIKVKAPTFDAKDKSADYIRSRFDAVLETDEDGIASQRVAIRGNAQTREDAKPVDVDGIKAKARQKMDSAPGDYLKRKMDERAARRGR
jgi:hypothetical protein